LVIGREYGIKGSGDMAGIAFVYWEPTSNTTAAARWTVTLPRNCTRTAKSENLSVNQAWQRLAPSSL